MVPSDYRLEHVCARLVERLEGARRSYDAERAEGEFRRIADEHVSAAMAELTELGPDAEHERFLRREVEATFLPRYARLAVDMNATEQGGYGFGALARPLGRLVLVGAGLVGAIVIERFALGFAPLWLGVAASVSAPLWPDLARRAHERRYEGELQSLLQDMGRIQEQAAAYVPPERLRAADTPPGRQRRARKETE